LKFYTVKHRDHYVVDPLFEKTVQNILDYTDNFKPIDLSKYIEYGYMMDSYNDEIIAMCGITDFGEGCYRVESGCWIHPKYRGNYFRPDNKYNHYALSAYQMEKFEDSVNVWFKSRIAKNPAGIARLIPEGWKVYPEMIELRWPNNWQWIVYKGEINEYLESLQASNPNPTGTH